MKNNSFGIRIRALCEEGLPVISMMSSEYKMLISKCFMFIKSKHIGKLRFHKFLKQIENEYGK